MSPFSAIIKLTWKSAIRSHVFQFLLFILLIGIVLIPNTIKGDGSAFSFIQVSLEYSLGFIFFMLMLSGVWLGCQTMTQDVEDARLHLIVVKPVSRVIVWLGKITGVMLVLTLLLLISSAIVYGFITFKYRNLLDTGKGTPSQQNVYERMKISNEILTGRRAYLPVKPDYDKIVYDVFSKQMSELDQNGRKKLDTLSQDARNKLLLELRRQIISRLGEVPPGALKTWDYTDLPKEVQGPVFLRYKVQKGQVSNSETRTLVTGAWGANIHYSVPPDKEVLRKDPAAKPEIKVSFAIRKPEQISNNMVNEIEWDGAPVIADGRATFGFVNFQKTGSLFFQQGDEPKLLIRAASFAENYLRAVLMLFLGILAITMISAAGASFLSMPTAIFFSISYMVFGAVSLYILGTVDTMYGNSLNQVGFAYFGYFFCDIVMSAVIPLQSFSVSDYVANGELIEWSQLLKALGIQVLLKGGPIALLGIWFYNRRELALASTKR